MKLLRFLFPSFEKPVARPRYINIEPESYDFRGIGTVLLLAASCGVALALWEPSHQVTSPYASASVSRPAAALATKAAESQETTAAADAEDDEPPTVKLSAFCSQRATARRDCASVKAFKDARLKTPDPAPAPAAKAAQPAVVPAKSSGADQPQIVSAVQPEAPAAQPQRTEVAAPKAKRQRPVEEAPVERLVKVYDQVLPDGRRVPVYRRVGSGSFETGTIVDGEYRPSRRANLEPQGGRLFGLQ